MQDSDTTQLCGMAELKSGMVSKIMTPQLSQ